MTQQIGGQHETKLGLMTCMSYNQQPKIDGDDEDENTHECRQSYENKQDIYDCKSRLLQVVLTSLTFVNKYRVIQFKSETIVSTSTTPPPISL